MLKKTTEIYEIDAITTLTAQVASLTKKLQSGQLGAYAMHTPPSMICSYCQGNHPTKECKIGNPSLQFLVEQANFVENFNK